MKKIILSFMLCVLVCSLSGQVSTKQLMPEDPDTGTGSSPVESQVLTKIKSPQVADFMRFTGTSIAKYTGRLDYSISLLSLSENDFNLPINLSYNSAGFIPSKNEGIVGLNWLLNVGGVITREVKGVPDDMALNLNDPFQRKGLLSVVKGDPKFSDSDVNSMSSDKISILGEYFIDSNDRRIETASDIYSFSFCGYTGKFMIGFDGKAKVASYSSGNFAVDFTNYNFDDNNLKSSSIKIISDDGTQYIFGGSVNAVEYSISLTKDETYNVASNPDTYITSFHLSKIIAPNGNVLNIEYEAVLSPNLPNTQVFANQKQNYVFTKQLVRTVDTFANLGGSGYSVTAFNQNTVTKIARIKAISTSNQIINFFYSERKSIYETSGLSAYSRCGSKLDSLVQISLNTDFSLDSLPLEPKNVPDKAKRRVIFDYSYKGGNYSRLFLDKVTVNNQLYKFDYYMTGLPNAYNCGVDFWGFWNGNSTYEVPTFNIDDSNNPVYISSEMDPNASLCNTTLLKRITFPAGGYTDIEYELHDFSSCMQNNQMVTDKSGVAGGARVRMITEWDGSTATKKVFQYYQTLSGCKQSTGSLYNWPKFYESYYTVDEAYNLCKGTSMTHMSSAALNAYTYESDHVQYSSVKEITVTPGSELYYDYGVRFIQDLDNENPTMRDFQVSSDPGVPQNAEITSFTVTNACDLPFELQINLSGWNGDKLAIDLYKDGVYLRGWAVKVTDLDPESLDRTTHTRTDRFTLEPGKYTLKYSSKTVDAALNGYIKVLRAPILDAYGPYTVSYFSNYMDTPNLYDAKLSVENMAIRDLLSYPTDCSALRGKLIQQDSYNSEDVLVHRISNRYIFNTAAGQTGYGYNCLLHGINLSNNLGQVYHVYLYPIILLYSTEWTYDTNGVNMVSNYTTYDYNSQNLLKTITTDGHNGKNAITSYTYPADYSQESPYKEMLAKNIINPVIEKKDYLNQTFISNNRTNYGLFHSLIYAPLNTVIQNKSDDSGDTRARYDYYPNSRLKTVTTDDAITTVYLWGYNGQYPVAKISNATYSEVETALTQLGFSSDKILSGTISDMTLLMQLRQKLDKALVSTYVYGPYGGMLASIDPIGIITYYDYDPSGRLTEVYLLENDVKKVLYKYSYHYKNQ